MPEAAIATLEIPQVVLDAAQMNVHDVRRELALTLYALSSDCRWAKRANWPA